MVLYTFILRRALLRENLWRVLRGFTLLELVLALFILGVLAAVLAPSMTEIVNRNRIDAEKRTLGDLADTTAASFENTDLTNLNLAALAGTIGPSDTTTEFSASSTAAYTTTNNNSWFAKIARLRGLAPVVGTPPTTAAQPALAQIAFNLFGNPRLLFAGPNESGKQRFLLLSLMARSDQLTLPAYDGTAAWFNAIWNADWESRTAAPPAYWSGVLTTAQLATSRALSLGGILLISFATYFLLASNSQSLAIWLLVTGVLAIALTIRIASRRNLRTRFRRQKPGFKDALVAAISLAAVILVVVL